MKHSLLLLPAFVALATAVPDPRSQYQTSGGGYSTGGGFPSSGGPLGAGGGFPSTGGYSTGGSFPSTGGGYSTGSSFPSTGGGYSTGSSFPSTGGGLPSSGGFPSSGGGYTSGGFPSSGYQQPQYQPNFGGITRHDLTNQAAALKRQLKCVGHTVKAALKAKWRAFKRRHRDLWLRCKDRRAYWKRCGKAEFKKYLNLWRAWRKSRKPNIRDALGYLDMNNYEYDKVQSFGQCMARNAAEFRPIVAACNQRWPGDSNYPTPEQRLAEDRFGGGMGMGMGFGGGFGPPPGGQPFGAAGSSFGSTSSGSFGSASSGSFGPPPFP